MHVRYFAWLKHRVGLDEEEVELPAEVRTVGALKALLAARHPGFAEAAASRGVLRCAVNHEHADDSVAIAPGDEVAFFPPVTGG